MEIDALDMVNDKTMISQTSISDFDCMGDIQMLDDIHPSSSEENTLNNSKPKSVKPPISAQTGQILASKNIFQSNSLSLQPIQPPTYQSGILQPTLRQEPIVQSVPQTVQPTPRRDDEETEDSMDDSGFIYTDMPSLLADANNKDWTVRRRFFSRISKLCNSERSTDISTNFEKIAQLYIEKFSDSHYKVVMEALQSMCKLVPIFLSLVEPFLERLFARLFLKLTDLKDNVRQVASALLETISENFSGDTLLPVLLKVSDDSNSKIRLACLEYILHVIPRSRAYLVNASHMRLCIMKLLSLSSNNKVITTCRKASVAGLMSLHKHNRDTFLDQLLLLPINEQIHAKSVLSTQIPTLEMDLIQVLRNKKPALQRKQERISSTIADRDLQQLSVKKPVAPVKFHIPQSVAPASNMQSNRLEDESKENQHPFHMMNFNMQQHQRIPTLSLEDEMQAMLSQINNYRSEQKRDCLKRIKSVLKENNDDSWTQFFAKILFNVFEMAHDEQDDVREDALLVLRDLLHYKKEQFDDFAEITLKRILDKHNDVNPKVVSAATAAAEQYLQHMDPLKTLHYIIPIMTAKDNPIVLCSTLKIIKILVQRIDPRVLLERAPTFVPLLFGSIEHSNHNVRKEVTFCLVEMCVKLGDKFKPYLHQLDPTRMKVVLAFLQEKV